MEQQEILKTNAAMFVQGFMERNWDMLQEQPIDVATVVMVELSTASIESALREASENPEAMIGSGQDWYPSISID